MTGEEKNTRSKRCLSRSKRSKFPDNDVCSDAVGTAYTAVRPKQTECFRLHGGVDHLESKGAQLSKANSIKTSVTKVVDKQSRNRTHGAFEFCDGDDSEAVNNDDSTDVCVETCSSKRKRNDSEELEVSGITKAISRFKRARSAVSNLSQPLLRLEKCSYSRKPNLEYRGRDDSAKRNKQSTNTKDLPNRLGSLHQLEEGHKEMKIELEKKDKVVTSLPNGDSKDDTDLMSEHALELSVEKTNSTRNQVCPVCSWMFVPTDRMDVINQHINTCLDKETNTRIADVLEPVGVSTGEDLFFCHLCQKDLSKMNSQRRQQHINRCCDQVSKAEVTAHLNEVQGQSSTLMQCPICGKGYRSAKTRHLHLKKCAQEYNVGTNQLLEIMHREQQQKGFTATTADGTDIKNVASSSSGQLGQVTNKRKRRGVKPKEDFDEETQIALALSASIAPPPNSDSSDKKSGKGKGKKKKGGNELPPLLLRDDETAQRAVAIRAAQVLWTQDDDDDNEISCTPALVPSRLAQNVPGYLHPPSVGDAHDKLDSASTRDSPVEENSESDMASGEEEKGFKEAVERCHNVDPQLSRSFLNFLYDVEVEETSEAEVKVPRPSPLWSLAALEEQSSVMFYVPGLLPPVSPQRGHKLTKKTTLSKMVIQNENAPTKLNDQAEDSLKTSRGRNLEGPKESVVVKKMCVTENDECQEITPSQAVDVEMLMELAEEDDICNTSVDSQHMMAASGFCVDEQEEFKRVDTVTSGVSKLLQDLSSMINNSHLSDVIFKLKDDHEMVAHSFILSLRSETLAQLLSEQRALCNKAASCGPWAGELCLKFDDMQQSSFEPVLRHIYTGDITVPEECNLDEITNLAERFNLPGLLKECKATREQMNQVCESPEDDGIHEYVGTDLDKLVENLWRNDYEGEFGNEFQTAKNKADEDNLLNDDDIDDIMIFQTQSLRRKQSVDCEMIEKWPSSPRLRITDQEGSLLTDEIRIEEQKNAGDRTGNQSISHVHVTETTKDKLLGSFRGDALSCNSTEKGNLSQNPTEEDDLSRDPNVTISLCHNLAEEGNLSHDSASAVNLTLVAKDTLLNSVENRENTLLCDYIKGEKMDEKQVESTDPKEKEKQQILTCDDGWLSSDCKGKEMIRSRTSCCESARVGEPISDLDDVEAQPEDHVQGDREEAERCPVNEQLSDIIEDVGMDFESENNADFGNISIDLLNDDPEIADGDVNTLDEANEILETLSDFLPLESEHQGLPFPTGGERDEVEHDLQVSPMEVTLLDDDEVEQTAANESITLISDNDEEVILDTSPPATNITVVPETPRLQRRSLQSISSKSSRTVAVGEEEGDDVSLMGSSPSKTRKKLSDEAEEFWSKLKERVGRNKGKKQGKEKPKKCGRSNATPHDSSIKDKTPTKQSPCVMPENRVGICQFSRDLRSSPRGFQPHDASPMWQSPGGHQARSYSPVCKSPGDFETASASPILVQEGCVSDTVTLKYSPPLSPVLVEPDSPQTSEVKRKGEGNSSSPRAIDLKRTESRNRDNSEVGRVHELEVEEPGDVEIVDINAHVCGALSTCFSPLDVMSPPVPSPEYSFMDHVSCPDSPVPCASPRPHNIALSPDPLSPSGPVDWKTSESESGPSTCRLPNSPVSPSVCSFSSQIVIARAQNTREDLVKKLDSEQSLSDKEVTETVEEKKFDPSIPLIKRLRAARGGRKILNVDEDSSDSNSDDDLIKGEIVSERQKSPLVSSSEGKYSNTSYEIKEMENIAMDTDFDICDDGGYNFDIEELNQLDNDLEGGNVNTHLDKLEGSQSEDDSIQCEVTGTKVVARKRKIPLSQRRVEDCSDDEDKTPEAPKKKGRKAEGQWHQVAGQTVSQPVTPMPNYTDMDTPALKNQLHKFGVRPLPKKKMILKLKEIYDYTHQAELPPQESKTERASNVANPLPSSTVVSHAGDEEEGSGTASSDDSDEEDTEFGDCTVIIEDEAITASQQVNSGNLKERLFSYIQNNKELYKKILNYKPLELVSLHQQIKSDGINCSLGKFVDFLDEQCITFTTAGSRTRAPRKQGGKKKKNKNP